MSPRVTLATALRVLRQLARDPRTLLLILGVPMLLMALLRGMFEDDLQTFQRIGVPLLGLFPFLTMFLVTSVAMLRERTSGTLERLMAMPMRKLDLLLGYALAFCALAAIQTALVSALSLGLLGLETERSGALIAALALVNAVLGVGFGLFLSAFARTEFQAVQFLPAFVMPQLLLSGLFVARDRMIDVLEWISWAFPLTYAYEALADAGDQASLGTGFYVSVGVTLGASLLALGLGAATLRRRTE